MQIDTNFVLAGDVFFKKKFKSSGKKQALKINVFVINKPPFKKFKTKKYQRNKTLTNSTVSAAANASKFQHEEFIN